MIIQALHVLTIKFIFRKNSCCCCRFSKGSLASCQTKSARSCKAGCPGLANSVDHFMLSRFDCWHISCLQADWPRQLCHTLKQPLFAIELDWRLYNDVMDMTILHDSWLALLARHRTFFDAPIALCKSGAAKLFSILASAVEPGRGRTKRN